MNDLKADMAARIAVLIRDFAVALPDRMAEMARHWDAAAAGSLDALDEARRVAHKVAGSAGTFGFPEIGEASSVVEEAMETALTSGAPLSAADISRISGLITRLKQLPKVAGKAATAPAPEPPPAPEPGPIGIVVDDPAFVGELKTELEKAGHRIVIATDLDGLAQATAGNLPRAIVADLVESGRAQAGHAMKKLRAKFGLNTPVVFIATRGDARARLAAAQAGGAAFATADTPADVLARRIDRLARRGDEPAVRVLIVEDDEPTARFYDLALTAAGLITEVAHAPGAALELFGNFDPEVILMDLYLPGASGLVLAEALRQHERWHGAPILFLSTETSVTVHMAARSLAADDFLVKPVEGAALAEAVRNRAARYRDLRRQLVGE